MCVFSRAVDIADICAELSVNLYSEQREESDSHWMP